MNGGDPQDPIPASATWEVELGGNDAYGGGFITGATGTDYSLSTSAHVTFNGTTVTATWAGGLFNSIVVSGYTVSTADIGNFLHITGGSNFTVGWYYIENAVVAGNTWQLNVYPGSTTASGMTGYMGGAFASVGQPCNVMAPGNNVFIKYNATPFSITSTTANATSGRVNVNVAGVDNTDYCFWVGYDTTRTIFNTDANRPTLKRGGSITSSTLFTVTSQYTYIRNIICDGNGTSGISCFTVAATPVNAIIIDNCHAKEFGNTAIGFNTTGANLNVILRKCTATSASLGSSAGFVCTFTLLEYCEAYNTPGGGFFNTSYCLYLGCISSTNGGNGFDSGTTYGTTFINCIATSNEADGFYLGTTASQASHFINCVAYINDGYGYSGQSNTKQAVTALNCAAGGNGSGSVSTFLPNVSVTSITADPFVNSASRNWAPNTTAGGGAVLRAAGYPGTMPSGTTVGYADIGIQHADPAATTGVTIYAVE